MKLFIIGNGFDLYFNLPTSVKTYKKIIEKDYILIGESAKIIFENYNVNWSEFEDSLSNFDTNALFEDYHQQANELADSEGENYNLLARMQSIVGEIISSKNDALITMVKNAEHVIVDKKRENQNKLFDSNLIISFNYTSTVETLFKPTNADIYHIHGYYRTNPNDLIFGYKEELKENVIATNENLYEQFEEEKKKIENSVLNIREKAEAMLQLENDFSGYEDDFFITEQKNIINQFYQDLKKNFKKDELKKFLKKYKNNKIEEVIVLGHSMGDVDSEYMEIIDEYIQPNIWYVSIYDDTPSQITLNSYSFSEKIKKVEIEDYI